MSDKVETRNRAVLVAAVALSQEIGYANITRDAVAERAGVAAGSVNNAYGTVADLRDAVMAHAVENELLGIIGSGVANGHPAARAVPAELQQRALAALAAAA
jgi:AcrR family transcriptional regulator